MITIKPNGKPVAHEGIKIECIGQIGNNRDRLPAAAALSARLLAASRGLAHRKGWAHSRRSLSCAALLVVDDGGGADLLFGRVVSSLALSRSLLPGCAELFYDRGNSYEFTSLVRELEGPGSVNDVKPFPFAFENVEKKFESYSGINVRLR